jgi:tetratricopeptide (TPR) repeat protein
VSRVYGGELATAEPQLLEAIALKRKVDGGDSADVAESMNVLAELYARRGEPEKAIDMTDQARAIYDREHGPEGIMSGRGYNNRCEYLSTLGRHGEALDACQKALAIWEAALGTDHIWLGYALTGIGVALTGLQRPSEALAPLRRALDIRKRREEMAAARAETWFALARAEWDAGEDHSAARTAAATARDEYAKAPGAEAKVRAIDAWLATHGGRATRR